MIKKLNMIDRFKSSMNPKKYVNFIDDKFGKAILYLIVLAIISGSVISIKSVITLFDIEKSFQSALQEDELNFEMKNGILNFEESTFKEEEGQFILLIDTTKELKELDSLKSITVHKESVIVFLKDGCMIRSPLSNGMTFKYSELGLNREYINNEKLINSIDKLKFANYIVIPIVIIMEFINMFISVFLISIIGVLNMMFSRRKLSYSNIFKFSIYSMTLPILISVVIPIERYVVLIGGFILIFALTYMNYYENREKGY